MHTMRRQPPLLVVIPAGCFFLTVAIWTAADLLSTSIDAVRLRNAVLVDARLLDVDRRVVDTGDGTREQVTVRYAYEFDGEYYEHSTQKLALFAVGATYGDRLSDALHSGEVVQCYVDPDQPSQSVLSKEFSIPVFILFALFPIGFGGAAILIATNLYLRARESIRQSRAAN